MIGIIGANFGKSLAKMIGRKSVLYDIKYKNHDFDRFFSKVDKVIVATPNKTHFKVVKKCLEAGKDVLCLKPFVLSTNEVRELFRIANKNKKVLKVGFNQRYRREIAELKDGSVDLVQMEWTTNRVTNFDDFYNVKYDLAVHLIDLALRKLKRFQIERKTEEYFKDGFQYYKIRGGNFVIKVCSLGKGGDDSSLDIALQKGNKIFRIKETGLPKNFNDAYTFKRMVDDFVRAKKSDDIEYLLKLTKILCW